MAEQLRPPIILFGNTRSGTSMVQNVLGEHPDVAIWYEPRTLWLCADPTRPHDEFDETDATPRVKRYIRRQFLHYQRRHGNRIVMEKTPANIFKIPYVQAIFPEATFLYIVRNPFSFISSVELKWQRSASKKGIRRRLASTPVTQWHIHGARLLAQQFNKRVLKRKYPIIWGPRYDGIEDDLNNHDMLTVIARQWAEGSRKAEEALSRVFAGQILRLKYEDFVRDPVGDTQRICNLCGLDMTEGVIKAAKEWVSPDRQFKWHRFHPDELAHVLPELRDEMARHNYTIPAEIQEAFEKQRGNTATVHAQAKPAANNGGAPRPEFKIKISGQ